MKSNFEDAAQRYKDDMMRLYHQHMKKMSGGQPQPPRPQPPQPPRPNQHKTPQRTQPPHKKNQPQNNPHSNNKPYIYEIRIADADTNASAQASAKLTGVEKTSTELNPSASPSQQILTKNGAAPVDENPSQTNPSTPNNMPEHICPGTQILTKDGMMINTPAQQYFNSQQKAPDSIPTQGPAPQPAEEPISQTPQPEPPDKSHEKSGGSTRNNNTITFGQDREPLGNGTTEYSYLESPTSYGQLKIITRSAKEAYPIPNANVIIEQIDESGHTVVLKVLKTNSSGITPTVELPAPPSKYSLIKGSDIKPYSYYDIVVSSDGYYKMVYKNVPIFDGIRSIQPVDMIPLPADQISSERIVKYVEQEPSL